MEESISGFKIRGSWGAVVEHGERITRALRDVADDVIDEDESPEFRPLLEGDAFEEWDEWRPKSHERLSRDVSEKTAEQAHVNEGEGERAGKNPDEDLQTAGEKLTESYEKLEDDDTKGAVERWQDSIDYVTRAADTAGRKALRKVEDTVYQRVMTQFTPYYFDNELVSANIQRVRGEDDEFVFEVNVNNDDLKDRVRDRLDAYEDVERWHVDTEKDTEQVEAAEGVEPPEEPEERPNSTTN
ncbi:DUF5828 family protein [Halobacteriaceae archaeon GCM10025711]